MAEVYYFLRRLVVLGALLCTGAAETSDAESQAIFRSDPTTTANITLSPNQTVSALLFWTRQPNTTAYIQVFTDLKYSATFNITQPNVWHLGYIYQPTTEEHASIKIPHGLFLKLESTKVETLLLRSDHEVFWSLCDSPYVCSLVSPIKSMNLTTTIESDTDGRLAFLVTLLVLGVLLLATLAAFGAFVVHSKRRSNPKPTEVPKLTFPPPPPLPRILVEDVESTEDTCSEHLYEEWGSYQHLGPYQYPIDSQHHDYAQPYHPQQQQQQQQLQQQQQQIRDHIQQQHLAQNQRPLNQTQQLPSPQHYEERDQNVRNPCHQPIPEEDEGEEGEEYRNDANSIYGFIIH